MTKAIVVDDSWTTRKLIVKMLTRFKIDSIEAANGQQAVKALETNPDVEIAFVDWNMPVMTGMEFLKQTRRKLDSEALKIIMVTANNEMHFVTSALEEGVDEYIMLPITLEVLEEKLALLGIFPVF